MCVGEGGCVPTIECGDDVGEMECSVRLAFGQRAQGLDTSLCGGGVKGWWYFIIEKWPASASRSFFCFSWPISHMPSVSDGSHSSS